MKRYTDSTVIGRVAATERLNSSVNGNPRYLVAIQGEDGRVHLARTNPDSALAYGIDNPEYRHQDHVFSLRLKRGNLCIENVQTLEDSPEVAL